MIFSIVLIVLGAVILYFSLNYPYSKDEKGYKEALETAGWCVIVTVLVLTVGVLLGIVLIILGIILVVFAQEIGIWIF